VVPERPGGKGGRKGKVDNFIKEVTGIGRKGGNKEGGE